MGWKAEPGFVLNVRQMFRAFGMKAGWRFSVAGLGVSMLLASCATMDSPVRATLIPTEDLPTVIALTVQAHNQTQPGTNQGGSRPQPSRTPSGGGPASLTVENAMTAATETVEAGTSPVPTRTLTPPASTSLPARPSATFAPPVPDAVVQIYRLGELSKVTSPIQVTTRLTSEWGKVVRIELYGEDGRLLARYLRTFNRIPWDTARVDIDLEFEISAAGEAGRLLVGVEDEYGRMIDINTVNLILLSSGTTQLNPATALGQRLIIDEPRPQALIQGGMLVISGRALANQPDQPLRVMLVGEDGRTLGQRLARIHTPIEGTYGTYVAEVPYTVDELTPARLVIFEEGEPVSDIAHLASIEVILVP